MVGLSSRMLANAQAMQGAVQAREQLLAQTELAQDASAINSDYAVKTSKNIKKRCSNHSWPCMLCVAVLCGLISTCCSLEDVCMHHFVQDSHTLCVLCVI